MPIPDCPETRAVAAAVADGTLLRTPRLAAHLQICERCLARVFGDYRRARRAAPASPAPRPPDD